MGDQKFSTVDMAVLGGVLGALLLLALIALVILIHKHYRHRFCCCCGGKSKVRGSVQYWARQSRKGTNPGLKSHRKGTWRDEWEQLGKGAEVVRDGCVDTRCVGGGAGKGGSQVVGGGFGRHWWE